MDLEADVTELGRIDEKTTVKEEGGLVHVLVDLAIVEGLELVPFSTDDDGIGALGSLVGRAADLDVVLDILTGIDNTRLREVHVDLLRLDLGVVDGDLGVLLDEVLDQGDGSRLTGVTSVLLEGEAEDGNLLVGNGVEEGGDNLADETLLLVLVHDDDLLPVFGDLGQVQLLREVDEVEDVLLEARTTETNRGLQELGTQAGIAAAGIGDLIDIGTGGLANGRQSVDGGDTLSKHGVGSLML